MTLWLFRSKSFYLHRVVVDDALGKFADSWEESEKRNHEQDYSRNKFLLILIYDVEVDDKEIESEELHSQKSLE